MDHEPEEVIKQQMLETRASLADKLETLEQQVVGTVHSASTAVTDTVDSVKEAVQQTVELAKTSVHDTMDAVKDTLDLSRHVREHPWIMVGGSVSVGFVAGRLLDRAGPCTRNTPGMGNVPSLSTLAPRSGPERNGGVDQRMAEEPRSASGGVAPQGLLGELGRKFEKEINMLKGLALGAMLGIARDMIAGAAPSQLGSQLSEIIDSATVKLGGQPIHGPVLNMFEDDSASRQEPRQNCASEERGRLWAHNVARDSPGPID
jgi:ElaB/YqjD/DUF883 family membrane-anchored ribosome-binding protein